MRITHRRTLGPSRCGRQGRPVTDTSDAVQQTVATACDRCGASATTTVDCRDGCPHRQCAICADHTVVEAIDELTYERSRR